VTLPGMGYGRTCEQGIALREQKGGAEEWPGAGTQAGVFEPFVDDQRGPMATYQILTWHGIPVQVRAREGRERSGAQLPERFMAAVDRAAMAAGLTGSDAYTEAFAWGEPQERPGTPAEVAAAVAAELDAQHPTVDWRAAADRARA
jgi:hypothetical protein